ncbi:MAG: hypothetical protein BWK78_06095 [Thiotrichaceae bacterium IS1]|nr:MAG: hypothetical protein BWK78_06095 [Thiotrichaceae bacterium IS1]
MPTGIERIEKFEGVTCMYSVSPSNNNLCFSVRNEKQEIKPPKFGTETLMNKKIFINQLMVSIFMSSWYGIVSGCLSGSQFSWETHRVETKNIIVEASPARFIKILITQLEILEFTLTVSNKTNKPLYFYPLRLGVSGFNHPELPLYISDIAGYDPNVQYPIEPEGNISIKVYISAEEINFQRTPHLTLQISAPPIVEAR